MNIIISNVSDKPIYEQIFNAIKEEIFLGNLKIEEMLPSIRVLAKNLRVSVITTKRAYDELEKAGYINVIPGKGSFVSSINKEFILEANLKKIEEHMEEIIEIAKISNISKKEIIEMFKLLGEEE